MDSWERMCFLGLLGRDLEVEELHKDWPLPVLIAGPLFWASSLANGRGVLPPPGAAEYAAHVSGADLSPVEERLFYMSFADPDLPAGTQFLGALILRAPSLEAAVTLSHLLRLNPGGEIAIIEAPPEVDFPDRYQERLMSKKEIEEMDRELGF